MKLSDKLYEEVKDAWNEAAEKPFVVGMAKGTLSEDRFRYYMLEDYLYLQDYIDILKSTLACADDPELKAFLQTVIEETTNETERVHVPNMRKIGISDADIAGCMKAEVISAYVDYMKRQLSEDGLIAGLTALLQCSWAYAYIGQTLTDKYPAEIAASPYGSWFESYTCRDYVDANAAWIDVLDRETANITPEAEERLCAIFRTCAEYENRFWDVLYGGV